jgi:hypothetical protein
VTEADAPDSDAARDDAPLTVPPGVPLSVWEWLLPPVFIVVLVGVLAWFMPVSSLKPYSITTASIVVVVAIVHGVFGFRAYTRWDDADVTWHARSMTAMVAAIAVFALPFAYGLASASLFATTGYRVAAHHGLGVGRVRSVLSARAWMRLKVIALTVGIIALVAHPLASAFGLGLVAWAMLIAASLVFGFTRRSEPPGYDPLPVTDGHATAPKTHK